MGRVLITAARLRHEPDHGELFHPYLFDLLDELGWAGHIGCEYRPIANTSVSSSAGTSAGLRWLRDFRKITGAT